MMNKKVTIIIPVFNAENTIKRCVDSLLAGSYKNLEIILIDDCSVDNSFAICREIQQDNDCNILVLHNNVNSGVSSARNAGLRAMNGDYLMFVDSDDWVEPDYVSTFVHQLEDSEQNFLISGYINHDELVNQKTTVFGWDFKSDIGEGTVQDSLIELYHGRLLQQLWNKIFIPELIKSNGIKFDETISIGEDLRFILQYLGVLNPPKIVFLNSPLYHYMRDNTSSLMSKFCGEDLSQPLYNFDLMLQLLEYDDKEKHALYSAEKRDIINQYAYRTMHNEEFAFFQKINKLKIIVGRQWKSVLYQQLVLMCKEKMMLFYRRIFHANDDGVYH